MGAVIALGKFAGYTCLSIGALQMLGGVRVEPGMADDATMDSHVRFMGAIFGGYGAAWLRASSGPEPQLGRLRMLAGTMALGGVVRLGTRATLGRPHRFHDLLLATELATPVLVEVAARRDRAAAR